MTVVIPETVGDAVTDALTPAKSTIVAPVPIKVPPEDIPTVAVSAVAIPVILEPSP